MTATTDVFACLGALCSQSISTGHQQAVTKQIKEHCYLRPKQRCRVLKPDDLEVAKLCESSCALADRCIWYGDPLSGICRDFDDGWLINSKAGG